MQQSRGKTDLGRYSNAYFPGAVSKPAPFLLPPQDQLCVRVADTHKQLSKNTKKCT